MNEIGDSGEDKKQKAIICKCPIQVDRLLAYRFVLFLFSAIPTIMLYQLVTLVLSIISIYTRQAETCQCKELEAFPLFDKRFKVLK
jgi:hypothetical protein